VSGPSAEKIRERLIEFAMDLSRHAKTGENRVVLRAKMMTAIAACRIAGVSQQLLKEIERGGTGFTAEDLDL
jgi:hypothetical protein